MCDSHLHTLGGKSEDWDVNISYSQHSSPLLLYSTPSAVCVCVFLSLYLSVPLPIFTPLSLCNSWVSSPTGPEPSISFPPLLTDSSAYKISTFLHRCAINTVSFIDAISVLFGCFHPSGVARLYFSCSTVSVQISLSGVWCNVIFCLSPSESGSVCLCCY